MNSTKVLVVDGSEPMRRVIRLLLRKVASEVHDCSTADEAMEAYGRLRPGWVVMDVELPGVDGLAATRRILEAFPSACIVLLTSFDDAPLRAAAAAAGARAYLSKERLNELGPLLEETPPGL